MMISLKCFWLLLIFMTIGINKINAQNTYFKIESFPDTFQIYINKEPIGKTPATFTVNFDFQTYFVYERRLSKKGEPDSIIKYSKYPGISVYINIKRSADPVVKSALNQVPVVTLALKRR